MLSNALETIVQAAVMTELADAVDDAIHAHFNCARSVAQLTESYENTDGDVFYEVMSFSFDI